MSKLKDLTNQDFGYWHVIKRAKNTKDGTACWLCKCKCGKEKIVSGKLLRQGQSLSCGCLRNERVRAATMVNETGKIYGYLYVERIAEKDELPRTDRAGVYWNCSCMKCGRKNVIVYGDYLRKGDTKSCGCLVSTNESKITQLLEQEGIKYKTQYKFKDLKLNKTGPNFMFDFAIIDKEENLLYLIEYDGQQHFNKQHARSNEGFANTQKSDAIKNEYCFSHNIPLIRIPYNEIYTLEDLKLESTRFLLTPNNLKQYYDRI